MLVTDASGTIADANPQAATLLGADVERLTGRCMDSLLMPASRAAWINALARLNAGAAELSCLVYRDKGPEAANGLRLTATRTRDGRSRVVALVDLS